MEQETGFIKVDVCNANQEVLISSCKITFGVDRMILSGENFKIISHGSNVTAIGYLENGIIEMKGIVMLSTESQMNLKITERETEKNRRQYLKVKIYHKTKLRRIYGNGSSRRSFKVEDEVEIRDMSIGGIGLYYDKTLFRNQKVLIDLEMVKPEFQAKVTVIRKERAHLSTGYRYKYGCRFTCLNSEEQREICQYVFKVDLENHRRKKEMEMHQ